MCGWRQYGEQILGWGAGGGRGSVGMWGAEREGDRQTDRQRGGEERERDCDGGVGGGGDSAREPDRLREGGRERETDKETETNRETDRENKPLHVDNGLFQDGGKQLQEGMEENNTITSMDLRLTECGQESEYCINQILHRNQEAARDAAIKEKEANAPPQKLHAEPQAAHRYKSLPHQA